MSRELALSLAVSVLALLALGGCHALVVPPRDPPDPVTVYVVEYGSLHTALLVPAGESRWLEYGYGELGWYGKSEDDWYEAVPAMMWDTEGCMSRREIMVGPQRSLEAQFDLTEILPITVGRGHVELLVHELEAFWNAYEGERLHHASTDRWFIPVEYGYSATYNCNDAVAEWLRRLECRVSNPAVIGGFRIQPEEVSEKKARIETR